MLASRGNWGREEGDSKKKRGRNGSGGRTGRRTERKATESACLLIDRYPRAGCRVTVKRAQSQAEWLAQARHELATKWARAR